ncbi:hypothetical protein TYRP_008378, partial [Tyrophagus putrescentiae]
MSTVPTDDYNVSISSAPSSTAAITIYSVSTKLVHPYETYDPNDQIAEESLDVPQTIVSPFDGK